MKLQPIGMRMRHTPAGSVVVEFSKSKFGALIQLSCTSQVHQLPASVAGSCRPLVSTIHAFTVHKWCPGRRRAACCVHGRPHFPTPWLATCLAGVALAALSVACCPPRCWPLLPRGSGLPLATCPRLAVALGCWAGAWRSRLGSAAVRLVRTPEQVWPAHGPRYCRRAARGCCFAVAAPACACGCAAQGSRARCLRGSFPVVMSTRTRAVQPTAPAAACCGAPAAGPQQQQPPAAAPGWQTGRWAAAAPPVAPAAVQRPPAIRWAPQRCSAVRPGPTP
mmetsp:Transcript_39509/g.117507  ORF Transcript_39509/g.117507 Transcript_39509/m.117507 type:complete len:278 (+) Transcript_39509:1179-2012(+)